ncbi:MAG: hypothetical protein V4692_15245 [Bdellovibrionota bacterium]
MKKIFLVSAFLLTATSASAEVSNTVTLRSVSVENGTMKFGYQVGGGCQNHTSVVSAKIVRTSKVLAKYVTRKAIISVADVTDAPDFCEALLYPTGEANLKEVVEAAIAKAGLTKEDANITEIALPKVDAYSVLR